MRNIVLRQTSSPENKMNALQTTQLILATIFCYANTTTIDMKVYRPL